MTDHVIVSVRLLYEGEYLEARTALWDPDVTTEAAQEYARQALTNSIAHQIARRLLDAAEIRMSVKRGRDLFTDGL